MIIAVDLERKATKQTNIATYSLCVLVCVCVCGGGGTSLVKCSPIYGV